MLSTKTIKLSNSIITHLDFEIYNMGETFKCARGHPPNTKGKITMNATDTAWFLGECFLNMYKKENLDYLFIYCHLQCGHKCRHDYTLRKLPAKTSYKCNCGNKQVTFTRKNDNPFNSDACQ